MCEAPHNFLNKMFTRTEQKNNWFGKFVIFNTNVFYVLNLRYAPEENLYAVEKF